MQTPRNRRADAARAAGDQNCFAVQGRFHNMLFILTYSEIIPA
jgi:hypothetical protein